MIIKEIKNTIKIKTKLLPYLPLTIIYQMLSYLYKYKTFEKNVIDIN